MRIVGSTKQLLVLSIVGSAFVTAAQDLTNWSKKNLSQILMAIQPMNPAATLLLAYDIGIDITTRSAVAPLIGLGFEFLMFSGTKG